MKEHSPYACPVCNEHGNWATTPDTEAWLEAHAAAGIAIELANAVESIVMSVAAYDKP